MGVRPPALFAETPREARCFMDEVYREAYLPGKIVAVDTEFVPVTHEPVLMSYSWGRGIRRVVRAELVREHFGDWLTDPDTKLAYQNYKADVETMGELGLSEAELAHSFYIDVMVAGVLRDETLVKHGLKAQMLHFLKWFRREYGQLFCYVPAGKKKPVVMDPRQVMDNLPEEALTGAVRKWAGAKGAHKTGERDAAAWRQLMVDYAGDDAEGTQILAVKHRRYLRQTDYWDKYVAVDRPFTLTLMQCERSGAFLDQPILRTILRKQDIRIMRAEQCFRAAAGNPKLNLRSGPQMKKLLFDEWGWPEHPSVETDSGGVSMDKEVLNWWVKEHKLEMAEVKLAFNNATTMKGTFLEGLLSGVDDDGRLRTDLNQIGAKTSGRISSRKFDKLVEEHRTLKSGEIRTTVRKKRVGANLQNIPARKEKDPDGIRRAFRAPLVGEVTAWGDRATEPHKLIVCVVPETRILKADMTWVPAGEINVGDKLVGFDEDLAVVTKLNVRGQPYQAREVRGQGTKLRESTVESVRVIKKNCFRVITDRGTVTASDEHMWVAKKRSSRVSSLREWIRTDDLEPGDEIAYLCAPWDVDRSYAAGYLAGIFDGEGWIHRGSVGFGQNRGPTLEMVKSLLTHCGFDYVERPQNKRRPKMRMLELKGNRVAMRFLGSVRPRRLLATYVTDRWQGTSTWGNGMSVARVLRVERVYDARGGYSRDVVAIKTSTKTFIAEGMLSHNCDYSGFHLMLVIHFVSKLTKESAMLDIMKKYGTPSAVHVYTTIQMFKHVAPHRCSPDQCKDKKTGEWKKCHGENKVYSLKEFTMDDWKLVKPIFSDQYTYSKNTNFALIFMGSPWTLAYNTGRDANDPDQLEECKRHYDDWYELYPEIPVYQRHMVDHGYEHGWVPTIGGRRGHVQKMLEGCDKNGKYIQDEEKRKKMVKHGERVCTNTPAQGCLHPSTRIVTRQRGCVQIHELNGARDLAVWDGTQWVRADVTASGPKCELIVRFHGGLEVRCSPDHRFLTNNHGGTRGRWTSCWKTPAEFQKQQFVVLTGATTWSASLDTTWPEVPSRGNGARDLSINSLSGFDQGLFLGRVASDGSVSLRKGGGCVLLFVAEHERVILPRLRELCERIGRVIEHTTDRSMTGRLPMYRLDVNSTSLARQIAVVKQRIPGQVWADSDVLRGYLCGLFDGDGCVKADGPSLCFGSGHRHVGWAREVQQALFLLGVRSRLRLSAASRVDVFIQKADAGRFAEVVGFLNPSKQDKLRSIAAHHKYEPECGRVLRVAEVIDTRRTVQMYDVVNSDTHQFVANGVITHNSEADIVKMALNKIRESEKMRELRAAPLFPVHDEILCEGPARTAQPALGEQIRLMKQPYRDKMEFELAVEGGIGDNWTDGKP